MIKDSGGAGSPLFWVRVLYEGVKYAFTFQIVEDTIDFATDIRDLIAKSSEQGQVYVLPDDSRLTEGNPGDVNVFPQGEYTFPGTPPFDLGDPIGFDDNAFFPKGDGFLDDILNGQFEFPDEGQEFTYFLAIEENNEILRDLIDVSTLGRKTKGRTVQYDSPGGFERANEIFDSLELSNVKELSGSDFDGRVGQLDDGRTVIVRDGSKGEDGEEGPPTLEIQRGRRRIKYRFFN